MIDIPLKVQYIRGRLDSKLVDKFTYLGISSTESDINMRTVKTWTAIDRLSIIWKSDLSNKIKREFFQAAVVSILLYACNICTLTKRLEKKINRTAQECYIEQILEATPLEKKLIYGYLPPIWKSITNKTCESTAGEARMKS